MSALPSGWHGLLETVPLSGAEQMARDAGLRALASSLGAPVLRIYGWDPACISFGAHEAAVRRYAPEAIVRHGLDVVRRPTGGRAVLHRRDLTFAVAVPAALQVTPAEALAGVHGIFADMLASLGVEASAAPRRRAPTPDAGGICFDAAMGGELLVEGGKVLGSAQHVAPTGLLQHGSLLLADPQTSLLEMLRTPPEAGAAPAITTVEQALGRRVPFEEAAERLMDAWRRALGPIAPLPTEAVAGAAAPHRATFLDPAWTWRR